MTKQDEIKEGIGTWLSYFKEGKQGLTVDDGVQWILGFLHSQGLVIKVDRELPMKEAVEKMAELFYDLANTYLMYWSCWRLAGNKIKEERREQAKQFFAILKEAGYVAVEPLILVKESK